MLGKRDSSFFLYGEVCKYIHVVLHPQACYLEVKLDAEVIGALQLDVTVHSVRHSLLAASKLKLKANRVLIAGGNVLHVLPPDDGGRAAANAVPLAPSDRPSSWTTLASLGIGKQVISTISDP